MNMSGMEFKLAMDLNYMNMPGMEFKLAMDLNYMDTSRSGI